MAFIEVKYYKTENQNQDQGLNSAYDDGVLVGEYDITTCRTRHKWNYSNRKRHDCEKFRHQVVYVVHKRNCHGTISTKYWIVV